jgi:hypothetical protein
MLDKPWVPPVLRGVMSWGIDHCEKGLSRCFDAILAATESIGRGFRHRRVAVIRNYPQLGEIEVSHHERVGAGEAIIIYAGGISETRGASEMIRAVLQIPDTLNARLDLVG